MRRVCMTNKQWLKLFNEEKDAAIKSQDIVQYKMFYYRWKARGMYPLELPSDETLEALLKGGNNEQSEIL